MAATSKTYTYWTYNISSGAAEQVSGAYRYTSLEEVTEGQVFGESTWQGRVYYRNVRKHEVTYFIGQGVAVQAYGRERPGQVTKLNPKKPVVRFIRNGRGDTSERSFHLSEMRPG